MRNLGGINSVALVMARAVCNELDQAFIIAMRGCLVSLIKYGAYGFNEIKIAAFGVAANIIGCLLYTSPSPRDQRGSRMPSSA